MSSMRCSSHRRSEYVLFVMRDPTRSHDSTKSRHSGGHKRCEHELGRGSILAHYKDAGSPCQQYCALIATTCTATNAQYTNDTDCLTSCSARRRLRRYPRRHARLPPALSRPGPGSSRRPLPPRGPDQHSLRDAMTRANWASTSPGQTPKVAVDADSIASMRRPRHARARQRLRFSKLHAPRFRVCARLLLQGF